METLSIQCTTCGSRLKVRDGNLAGQIIACPKCGSMVEIPGAAPPSENLASENLASENLASENPQRIAVGPEGAVDSQAITRDSISQAAAASGDLPEPPSEGPVFQSAGLAAPPPPPESRLSAADFAQSDRAKRTRQIGLVAALSLAGLFAALMAFGLFVRWWQSDSPANATLAQSADPPQVAPADEASVAQAQAALTQPEAAEPTNDPQAPAVTPDHAPPDHAPPDHAPPADAPPPLDDAAAMAAELAAPRSNPAVDGANDDGANAADKTADEIAAAMVGPAVLDSAELDDASDQDPAGAAAAGSEMPAAMKRWTRVLNFNNAGEPTDLPAPPTIDQIELDLPAVAVEGEFEAAPKVDVERGLSRRLAFDKRPAPLLRWTHLLAQLSAVPIGIDMVSLDAAGIDPHTAVTPPGGWLTVDEVLAQLAAQAHCQVRKSDTMVLIEASLPRFEASIARALRVDDLIGRDPQPADTAALVAMLTRLSQSPEIQLTPENDHVLQVQGPPSTLWLTALTAEGLRIARGLPPRLPRQQTARWLVSEATLEWPLLAEGQAIAPIDQPRPAIELLVRISRQNDALPLVHWEDALSRGLAPTTESMPWLKDATASTAINEILDPHQLQARIAGDGLWWIGAESTYDSAEVVAIIEIDPAQSERILQRLANSVGVADVEQLTAVADPHSPYLIIRAPRFVVRQLPKIISPQLAQR